MIKHIVLFQLKSTYSSIEKSEIVARFKIAIEALPTVIPHINSIRVEENCNVHEKWDICLESTFATMEDLIQYAKHPAHIEAAKIIAEAKSDRACVDYEYL